MPVAWFVWVGDPAYTLRRATCIHIARMDWMRIPFCVVYTCARNRVRTSPMQQQFDLEVPRMMSIAFYGKAYMFILGVDAPGRDRYR
jgi:hypothetical protein